MDKSIKPKNALKRSDKVVPDYDYLFNEDSEKNGKKKTRFFKNLIKMNLWSIIYTTIIYVIQAAPTWIMPIVTANIINITTEAVQSGMGISSEIRNRLIINAVILFVSIAQNVPTTMWRYRIVSKTLRETSAGIKSSVVRKLQSLSITYHKDMRTGRIQSKFLKDTDTVDGLFNIIMFSVIPNAVGVVVATIISVVKNGFVALFFLLVIPVNVLVSYAFRKKVRQSHRDFRIKTESMSMRLTNMLEMLAVTKAHGLEETEINSVEDSIKRLKGSGIEMDKVSAKFGASSWVVNNLLSALCLVFCAFLALKGVIKEVGEIVLYQSMFTSISAHVSGLINVAPQVSGGFEALSSVSEIMNVKDVEVNIGKKSVPEISGALEFNDVYYRYPNTTTDVIKGLNLSVKQGECIAFVGASGSGKSTIMNLIIGLLVPTKGEVLIDGKRLTEFNLSEYRHHISVVPQNSILFSGSIRDNITYGLAQYSEEQLNKAVELANVKEFLGELSNGIDTEIGEHGDKLSGGQKQRITIARALIRNPKILILDEATSALDNISEYHVQKAIASSIRGRTTFIVAHRLSTIRDADRIVVMENGEAIEMGTYNELMEKKGKFYELKCLNEMNLKTAEEGLN